MTFTTSDSLFQTLRDHRLPQNSAGLAALSLLAARAGVRGARPVSLSTARRYLLGRPVSRTTASAIAAAVALPSARQGPVPLVIAELARALVEAD